MLASLKSTHDFTQEALQRQEDLELELKARPHEQWPKPWIFCCIEGIIYYPVIWGGCNKPSLQESLLTNHYNGISTGFGSRCSHENPWHHGLSSRSFEPLRWQLNLKKVGWRVKAGRKNCGRPRPSQLAFFGGRVCSQRSFSGCRFNWRFQDAFEFMLMKVA